MRILVTGARGFIGQPTLQHLRGLSAENAIHAVSRQPHAESGAEWHTCDLLHDGAALVDTVRPDVLVHLAWETEHGAFWESPANGAWVDASLSMIEAFLRAGGRHIVIAGTCAEYTWGADDAPLNEDRSPTEPESSYGRSKVELHKGALEMAGDCASVIWARLFFPYGPGEDPRKLVSATARSLLTGHHATIMAGAATRDFVLADDAGLAFANLATASRTTTVNIGSGEATTLRTLGRVIEEATCSSGLLEIAEGDDRRSVVADVRRLREEFGVPPPTPLDLGVARTVDALRRRCSPA